MSEELSPRAQALVNAIGDLLRLHGAATIGGTMYEDISVIWEDGTEEVLGYELKAKADEVI